MFNIFKKDVFIVFFKLKQRAIFVSGPVFDLYTKFTVFLLFICLVLLESQHLRAGPGKPITCSLMSSVAESKELNKVVETYCWMASTFLVMPTKDEMELESLTGLKNPLRRSDYEKKYYAYYQWVVFAVFLQSLVCYFPRYCWEYWEDGLMRKIVEGVDLPLKEKVEKGTERKKLLVRYLVTNLNHNTYYAFFYWFCEVLCALTLIAQLFFINWFFSDAFRQYGLNLIGLLTLDEKDPASRMDPFIYIFPRVTKCIFRKFGPTQTIITLDALCLLNLNNINEKIYVFFWFWYLLLAVVMSLVVVYRLFIASIPQLRGFLLHSRGRMIHMPLALFLARKMSIGDWWIFYTLSRNVDPLTLKEVAMELGKAHSLQIHPELKLQKESEI